jgi:ABC-type transporter Mla subunit MlaD
LTDSGSSEITFGRSDTRVSELEQTATALRASLDDLAKKNQDAVASLAAIVKKQDDVSSALAALQKTSDSFTSKFDALSKVSLLKAVLGGGS